MLANGMTYVLTNVNPFVITIGMKRIGTMTRQDHERGVMNLYARYIALGMEPEAAIEKAGADWRAQIEAQGAKEIAGVKKFLGIKD